MNLCGLHIKVDDVAENVKLFYSTTLHCITPHSRVKHINVINVHCSLCTGPHVKGDDVVGRERE